MTRFHKALLYPIILFVFLFALESIEAKVTVSVAGGNEQINSFNRKKTTYISFSEIVDIIGGELNWKLAGLTIEYAESNNRFLFTVGSPYFKLNDSVFNLTFPAELKNGQLFLPIKTFVQYLDRIFAQKITWNRENSVLRIDSEYFNVTDLAVSKKANGLLIELFLTSNLSYEIFMTEGNWVNISVRDGTVNRSRVLSRFDRRFMYKLKAHQIDGAAQVSFRLKRTVENWHHKLVMDPPRIQISIADINFELDPTDTPATIGPDEKINIIVIDAGHGGSQSGAVGPGKTREKDIALDIAKRLAKLIRKDKEFKVIMTRDRDKTVTLQKRADIANRASADLFISIHANSSLKRSVRGWNVFFLAQARNDSARAVAQFENSAFLRDQDSYDSPGSETDENALLEDPVLSILNEMIMTEFQAESHDFAMMVDREFRRSLRIPARGVDQAGFFVLNMVFTPSILVETGFISNKREEKILKSRKHQQKVAESIYRAIKRFKAKYEN